MTAHTVLIDHMAVVPALARVSAGVAATATPAGTWQTMPLVVGADNAETFGVDVAYMYTIPFPGVYWVRFKAYRADAAVTALGVRINLNGNPSVTDEAAVRAADGIIIFAGTSYISVFEAGDAIGVQTIHAGGGTVDIPTLLDIQQINTF